MRYKYWSIQHTAGEIRPHFLFNWSGSIITARVGHAVIKSKLCVITLCIAEIVPLWRLRTQICSYVVGKCFRKSKFYFFFLLSLSKNHVTVFCEDCTKIVSCENFKKFFKIILTMNLQYGWHRGHQVRLTLLGPRHHGKWPSSNMITKPERSWTEQPTCQVWSKNHKNIWVLAVTNKPQQTVLFKTRARQNIVSSVDQTPTYAFPSLKITNEIKFTILWCLKSFWLD